LITHKPAAGLAGSGFGRRLQAGRSPYNFGDPARENPRRTASDGTSRFLYQNLTYFSPKIKAFGANLVIFVLPEIM